MTTAIIAVLGILMVSAAIMALLHKTLVTAILSAGAVSLVASIIYLFLAAPDVAMTEAAIGSALTTVVFLFALSRLREKATSRSQARDQEQSAGETSDGK
jgi:energy-converting hydrogenase B subunit D